MKRTAGLAVLLVSLASALAAKAQPPASAGVAAASPSPGSAGTPYPAVASPLTPNAGGSPAPPGSAGPPVILPGSLSGSAESASPGPTPNPATSGAAPVAMPTPGPSSAPASRFHLQRPGTDVDGDLLTGNAGSDIYVFRGNVVLRSDPKIDREFATATESAEPITITADEIDVDQAAATYVAKGHMHFVQGDRSGRADTAMLNEGAHTLDLLGNADVLEGEQRMRAAKMHYDTADRRFHGSGNIRIYQPLPTPNPNVSATPAPKHRRRLPL